MLYSPSDPLGDEGDEEMDWAANLGGVRSLYDDLDELDPATAAGGQQTETEGAMGPQPPPPPLPAPPESAGGGPGTGGGRRRAAADGDHGSNGW
jgi:hypothetical protein